MNIQVLKWQMFAKIAKGIHEELKIYLT